MVLSSISVLVEQAPQNGCHQHLCPQVDLSCLLSLQVALQNQQVGLTQSPFKLLILCWYSEHVRFCANPLRVESLFLTALQSSCTQAPLSFKAWCSGACLPNARPPGWGTRCGAQTLHSLGRTSAVVIILLFVGHLAKGVVFTVLHLQIGRASCRERV